MDPNTLILTALASLATTSGQTLANEAVKEAYNNLKALILHRFAGKPQAELALTEHETDPQTWQAPLKKVLREEHLDQDPEIIQAAQRVLQSCSPVLGKNSVQSAHIQGLIQGDNAHQTNHF